MPSTLYRGTKINVGPGERLVSLLGGGAALVYAMTRPSRPSFLMALGGGYLLYRGMSGNCLIYEALDIQRAGPSGQAGIQVKRSMTINKPRAEVYRFWRDFENLPSFMQHLESVEVFENGEGTQRSHWIARAPVGEAVEWDAEIVVERENESIAWRTLPGSEIENMGSVRFEDAPGGRGTEVHVSLRYDPPAGSASAAFARLFGEEPGQQVRDDLRRFKEVIETGETPTTFGQTSGRTEEAEREREEIRRRRHLDVVEEASKESFPASDSPAWTVGPEL